MKRKLPFRRCLAMLLLLAVSALSWAYDFEVDGIHYLKNDDGTSVTVTYKPNDNDYSGYVTIPASVTYEDVTYSVTGIGYDAFSRCSGLTSISIPNSVTYISPNAFENCSGLTSITIPESVTEIDGSAFSGCSGLTSITIPESVTGIGSCVFRDCSALTSIIVASGNKKYDSRGGCNAVIEIASNTLIAGCKNTVIPDGVTGIAYGAFSGCSGLTSITIPESVTYISSNAFENCSCLESISVDANNKSFDSRNNCNAIIKTGTKSLIIGCKNTIIPESVTSIGDVAFYGCSGLTSITIPNSVTTIGDAAFRGCTSLPVIDNVRYADTYLVGAVDKTLSSYTIKEGTRFIGGGAFGSCSKLTSIDIPESVTEIGGGAFFGCSGLTSITIPESVRGIGSNAFGSCSKLTSVTIESNAILSKSYDIAKGMRDIFGEQVREYIIGDGVTSIGYGAFSDCYGLTSVKIPESVTSIGYGAFSDCSSLTSVKIPESVTSIGNNAFYGCTSLPVENNLRYADTYLITAVGEAQSTYNIKEGTRFIGNYAFNVENCSVITSITIPNSVIMIGDYAFYGCTGLPVIDNLRYADTYLVGTVDKTLSGYTIKEGTRFIGSAAFSGCSGLTSVTIPNSVTSIGESAFYNCSGLTSVVIGNSVTSIGEFAFENCSGLTSVTCLVTKSDRSTEDIVAPVEPTQPVMPEPGIDPSEITERLYPFNPAHNTELDPPTTANCEETTEVTAENVFTEAEIRELWLEYYKKVYNTRTATTRRNNKVNLLLSNPYIIRGNELITLNQYRNEWNQYIVALNYFEYGYARILAGYNCLKDLGYYPMPSIEVSAFNEIPLDATLYVYENVMAAYKVTSPWNKFGTILPIDPSDVREMKSSDANNDENAPIYDLNGRRLTEKPKKGFYIQGGRKYVAQ